MDFTLLLSLIAFLGMVASWIILPTNETEKVAVRSTAASASKA